MSELTTKAQEKSDSRELSVQELNTATGGFHILTTVQWMWARSQAKPCISCGIGLGV
jgi:hypothetical protein